MLRLKLLGVGVVAGAVSLSASYACAEDFSAKLSGFNEIGSIPTSVTVPTTPSTVATGYTGAVLSDGRGTVKLELDKNAGTIAYSLT
jgi:hypothetical protein